METRPETEAPMLKEVTCLCGWVARGTDDEVVEQLTLHAWEDHGVRKTREEILAGAIPVAPDVS
jgi:predicted small metal-binding protein